MLRDYVRSVDIGAFHEERGAKQRLRFGLELFVTRGPRAGLDDVDGILSYDGLVDAVEAALAEERVELLETLAERIAAHALLHPRARRVRVMIEKLDRGAYALGVRIVRRRADCAPVLERSSPVAAAWVVHLSAAALADARLPSWVEQTVGSAAPVVLAPAPLATRPRAGGVEAQRHIDLLSQDQAAWLVAASGSGVRVAASRTELDAVLHAGDVAVWAPSRLVLRAVDTGRFALDGPADQAAWLAEELGAAQLFGLGAEVTGGTHLKLRDRLDLPGGADVAVCASDG